MKRIFLFIVLIILTTGIVFADLQFEMALGYHFTTNTFDTLSRSFNGINFSATNRVFLTERIGWLLVPIVDFGLVQTTMIF